MARSVIFVGKADSLELHIDSQAAFEEVLREVTRKLEESGSFFAGSNTIYVLGTLSAAQCEELRKLLTDGYGFKQVEFKSGNVVNIAAEKVNRNAAVPPAVVIQGGAVQVAQQDVKLRTAKRKGAPLVRRDENIAMPVSAEATPQAVRPKDRPSRSPFNWGVPKQRPLTLRNEVQKVRENHVIMVYETIRSGQSVAYDGDIVVLGDVNRGAELIATGSIVVMGVLRGMAHAGSAGDETASVSANRLVPQQLRIGARLAIAPDDMQDAAGVDPERAYVEDGEITIQHLGQIRSRKRR